MKKYWENLKPFQKRVFVGVVAMVFVLVNFWFVFPHFSDWNDMKGRMYKAQDKQDRFQAEIDKTHTYESDIAALEGANIGVPSEDQAANFASTIQTEGLKVGINPNLSTSRRDTNRPFFVEYSVQVSFQSKEQELVEYLYNLGASNSLITVRDLTLRPADQNRYQLNAGLKLVASYRKNPPKPVVAAAAPKNPLNPLAKQPTPTIRTGAPTNKAPAKTTAPTNKPPPNPLSKQPPINPKRP